jgi:hypothetical protein
MAPTTDGGMVVAGYSNSPDGGDKTEKNNGAGDFWILKLDKAGNLQWQRTLGGSRDDEPFAIRQTFDGNFIVGGTSNSSSSFNKIVSEENGSDIWLVKIDQDGQNLWQQDYDYGRQDMLMTICENPDHTLLLGGFAKNNPGGGNGEGINDYIAIKTDEKGELLWRRFVGSDGEDVLRKLIVTRDGGYVLAGTSNPEEKSIAPRRKKKGSVGTFGIRQVNNAAVDDLNQQLDAAVQDQVKSVNGLYKRDAQQAIDSATRQVSDATDSRLKIGGQAGDILSAQNKGGLPENNSSAIQQGGPKPGLTASRQKKTNFGGNDFWIVKLKDKDKPEKAPAMVEAFPNPAYDYTPKVGQRSTICRGTSSSTSKLPVSARFP